MTTTRNACKSCINNTKSTQPKNLSKYFSGTFHSVGNLFREVAAKRGITVAEQAKLLLTERGIDVEIDYKTCEMISGENISTNLGVIEGRQPAYMGSFMENLGKKNIVRIYFQCSIRDQALRFLRREIGEDAYTKGCLLYTSPSPRDKRQYRMPSSA